MGTKTPGHLELLVEPRGSSGLLPGVADIRKAVHPAAAALDLLAVARAMARRSALPRGRLAFPGVHRCLPNFRNSPLDRLGEEDALWLYETHGEEAGSDLTRIRTSIVHGSHVNDPTYCLEVRRFDLYRPADGNVTAAPKPNALRKASI